MDFRFSFAEGQLKRIEEAAKEAGAPRESFEELFSWVQNLKNDSFHSINELFGCLHKIYEILNTYKEPPVNALNESELTHHLMHFCVPQRSEEITKIIFEIITKFFTPEFPTAKLAYDAGFYHFFLQMLESNFPISVLHLIIISLAHAVVYFHDIKMSFLGNHQLQHLIEINEKLGEEAPLKETIFFMSCILESPTDPNIIEPCYNFVLQYMNRPELIENIFDALGECIQSSRRLKNLSLNNGVLEFSEKIAVSEDVNPLVRAQAVSFFRKLLDWEESLTYQHVTVEFLMAISNLLEYQIPQVQEITILAIIQLSLNCSIGMRILQAGIVTKLMGILSADLPYKVKISASLLSAALLCEENVNLAMKVYEATFDIAFELLLSSDHENWQMHALDSLLKFTATIEAHGLAQASQLTEKKWLVEIIDELVESQVPRVSDLARHLRETVFANVSE